MEEFPNVRVVNVKKAKTVVCSQCGQQCSKKIGYYSFHGKSYCDECWDSVNPKQKRNPLKRMRSKNS